MEIEKEYKIRLNFIFLILSVLVIANAAHSAESPEIKALISPSSSNQDNSYAPDREFSIQADNAGVASVGCWSCESGTKESASEGSCSCNSPEKCKDAFKKSTATAGGTNACFWTCTSASYTDYCKNSDILVEYYADCYCCDEVLSTEISCSSKGSYKCQDGKCVSDPCGGVTCPDKCDPGEVRKYSGSCSGGACSYSGSEDCDNYDANYCDTGNVLKKRDGFCQSGACKTSSSTIEDCDDRDESSWTYFCESSCIKRKKKDYSCSGTSCTYSWVSESLSCKGDGDYCSDRAAHTEACGKCGYEDFDCDYDTECVSSSPDCVDNDGGICAAGWECGCCNTGNYWQESNNKCLECRQNSDCGTNSCTGWGSDYCSGEDYVNHDKTCTTYACSSGKCSSSSSTVTESVSQNGNDDFCSKRKSAGCSCGYGKYDCDYDTECASSAPDCVDNDGGICAAGWECGCCNTGDYWDDSNNQCYSCNDNDGDTYYPEPRCVRATDCNDNDASIKPGATEICNDKDDDCDGSADEGFDKNTDENNCGSCGNVCSSPDTCENGVCSHPVVCDDGLCDPDENCVEDCLEILQFENPPSEVDEGASTTIKVKVKNKGTIVMKEPMEVGIVPKAWEGSVYSVQAITRPTPKCCPGNEYYAAKEIELNGGETFTASFSLYAPSRDSMDDCGDESAWDNNGFNLIAGFYKKCAKDGGDGYTDFIKRSITVNKKICQEDGVCEGDETYDNCPNDCPCNFDDVCNNQETAVNCRDDCGCDNDRNCESQREEDEYNCPRDCIHNCPIPDGVNWDCDCDSDTDCDTGYFCDQVSGPDACKAVVKNDECSNHNDYFCENGNVFFCENAGSYYKKKPIEPCNRGYFCDEQVVDGTGKCSKLPIHLDVWIDSADIGTPVNKQPDDRLALNIYTKESATVGIDFDENVFSGECQKGSKSLPAGLFSCSLSIAGDAQLKPYIINAGTKTSIINVMKHPKVLFITDSEKLNERFPHEERGVKALLAQAYSNARDEDGVVYDLSAYKDTIGFSHPFVTFSKYGESIFQPSMNDNGYALAVSSFAKGKCDTCTDMVIVGDDFVIPMFRSAVQERYGFWRWKWDQPSTIYSDYPLIKKNNRQLNEVESLFPKKKDVAIIIPDEISEYLDFEVLRLKDNISKMTGGNTEVIRSSKVGCNSFALAEKSLIVIGNRENNRAWQCMASVPDISSSILIERNVWDGNNFAIILQPDYSHEEESFRYDSIIGFTKILNDGANKEWIWKDSLIACVWDAKYDGTSHPFLYRVGCNIIPIADVINDIRDSKRCALSLDRDFVDEVVCGIVYAASLFDVAKYVGLLTAVGFVAGTVIDVGPATAKSAAKEAATELALGLGKVARGNIIGTIKSPTIPFKLLWTFTKLTFRGVTDPVGTLKGLLHVLQHGKDVALATLEFIRIFFKQEWDYQAIEGAGYLHKFKETLEVDYNGLKPELVPSMSKMFSEGQFEFSFKTSVNELRLGNNLPTGIIFRDPGNGRFFIDFTPRQFSINPGKIGISAQPDAVYKGLYFFRHPDINIRNDFRNLANMDSKELNKYLNGIGKEDEYLKLEQAYFSDIQNNFLRHELVHNKFDAFGDVNTLVKRNPDCGPNEGWCDPYNLLRFFDETLADDFNFKSINEQGQLKQYKEILYQRNIWVGIDSLDNGAPSKNVYDEGLSFTESLVKNDFNKKIPEEIVRQRILLKGIDPSGIRLKDFDAEVLRILKNDEIIKNRFSTPEELFGLINDLTKNYEDNLKKVSKIMEKSSFSYDDVQEFKIILQEVYDKTHQIRDIFY